MAKKPPKKLPYRAFWGSRGSETAQAFGSALGDAILAWSYAENVQTYCFAELLSIDAGKAHRLYQKLPNFRSRTAALVMLIDQQAGFAALRGPVLKLSSLSKTRNLFIHGFYLISDDHKKIRLIDFDEPVGPKRSRPSKANDVHQHAGAVRARATELNEALKDVKEKKAASPSLDLGDTSSTPPRSILAPRRRPKPIRLP